MVRETERGRERDDILTREREREREKRERNEKNERQKREMKQHEEREIDGKKIELKRTT